MINILLGEITVNIMVMYVFAEPKVNSVNDGGRNVAAGNSPNTAGSTPSAVGPSLGGLFAGGFPVLKSVGQKEKQTHHNLGIEVRYIYCHAELRFSENLCMTFGYGLFVFQCLVPALPPA